MLTKIKISDRFVDSVATATSLRMYRKQWMAIACF
jgi:hypothetical protein